MAENHQAIARALTIPYDKVFENLNREEINLVNRRVFYRLGDARYVDKITMGRYLGQHHSSVIHILKTYDHYVAGNSKYGGDVQDLYSRVTAMLNIAQRTIPKQIVTSHANKSMYIMSRSSSYFIYPGLFGPEAFKTWKAQGT